MFLLLLLESLVFVLVRLAAILILALRFLYFKLKERFEIAGGYLGQFIERDLFQFSEDFGCFYHE